MELVLDASATLAWLIERVDSVEARLADDVLRHIQSRNAVVPALWFPEVVNGVLVAERRGGVSSSASASFMGMVYGLPISEDTTRLPAVQATVLTLARTYKLTGYDATYLELVLRVGGILATFDGHLANAVRLAGGRVFGDAM
jgi:predicted nucleic acid-binding protein